MGTVEIINGDHKVGPRGENWPFVVIERFGLHVDLTEVGQLWDATVQHIVWGLRELDKAGRDRIFGRIELKNGDVRKFYDAHLMVPYVDAYVAAKARHEATVAAVTRALPPMQEQTPR